MEETSMLKLFDETSNKEAYFQYMRKHGRVIAQCYVNNIESLTFQVPREGIVPVSDALEGKFNFLDFPDKPELIVATIPYDTVFAFIDTYFGGEVPTANGGKLTYSVKGKSRDIITVFDGLSEVLNVSRDQIPFLESLMKAQCGLINSK